MSDLTSRTPVEFSAVLSNVESLVALVDATQSPAVSERGEGTADSTAKIVIVDDEPINIMVTVKYLETSGFTHIASTSESQHAFELISRENPDVLLLDIMMPGIDGLDILRQIRSEARFSQLPVIILTAVEDRQIKAQALELGATDFLSKPVDPMDLVPRVRNALSIKSYQDHLSYQAQELKRQVQRRTAELAASRLEVIHCLGRAAEFRDNDTGMHVMRVGRYAAIIAQQLGLDESMVELIEHAAPLHDLGKIGIPDAILLKPGKLEFEEFEFMKRHCEFGIRIVEETSLEERRMLPFFMPLGPETMGISRSPTLRMAGLIALTHHEKWDGSGYPIGLRGEEIPIEGRITAVADVFDALSSSRPYKPAYPLEKCFALLEEGRGRHFDSRVLDAFFARKDDILTVMDLFSDHEQAGEKTSPAEDMGKHPLMPALPTDDPTLRRIVERFVERLGEQLDAGRQALQAGDLDRLYHLARWLNCSARAMGLQAIAKGAERLEQMVTDCCQESIGSLLDELVELRDAILIPAVATPI